MSLGGTFSLQDAARMLQREGNPIVGEPLHLVAISSIFLLLPVVLLEGAQ